MGNFLEFILEDVKSKKVLFSTMPTTTKTNIRKFNEKIDLVDAKYQEYQDFVKKYIDIKSKSFNIADKRNLEGLRKTIKELEEVRFILNPSNTYFEKMGFDVLFYQISNYQDFKLDCFNKVVNELLDKFLLAGVVLTKNDFNYTCYVNEFMTCFLNVRDLKLDNYEKVEKKFEKIYWVNPEIISHIELNFRKLVRKNAKTFVNYLRNLQEETMTKHKLNYNDCLDKLSFAYEELNEISKENISDIIEMAKNKTIDINTYFEDSKVRISVFKEMTIDPINMNDTANMNKFYEDLDKLRENILEFRNYLKFLPLIKDFKNTYFKKGQEKENTSNGLKEVEAEITKAEKNLDKINKIIFTGKKNFIFSLNEKEIKQLKFDSIKLANELHELYKKSDKEFFKSKVYLATNDTFTVSDLLNLYYSYDSFKKSAIKKVFEITNYEELVEYSCDFDLFAMNMNNVILNGVTLSSEDNLAKVIVNKNRLVNINITENDLTLDNIDAFLNKIDMLIRIGKINNSSTTVEKIWFMAQVAKINSEKNK